jgi:flagellar biosynthesis protein FliQ
VNANDVLDIARETIIVALKLGAPCMLLALAVGLAVAFFQALTQMQEMTLTFVPKIVVIMIALLIFLPYMLTTLMNFMESLMSRVITG